MKMEYKLTIEKSVIIEAKKYAKSKGSNLSDIIANYLKGLTVDEKVENQVLDLPPIVKSLKGCFKAPANFNYKEALIDTLEEKYLKK